MSGPERGESRDAEEVILPASPDALIDDLRSMAWSKRCRHQGQSSTGR